METSKCNMSADAQENVSQPLRLSGLKRAFKAPALATQPNKKATSAAESSSHHAAQAASDAIQPIKKSYYFFVLYCKHQPAKKLRKNKHFNDGVLEIKADDAAALYAADGKPVVRSKLRGCDPATMGCGSGVVIGSWEVEVDAALPPERFLTGEAFLKSCSSAPAAPPLAAGAGANAAHARPPKGPASGFTGPSRAGTLGGGVFKSSGGGDAPTTWLHDPHAEGAVVLNAAQWAHGAGVDASGRPVTPVVVDPYIARQLRPHQVEGVRFLYECTMGLRDRGCQGAILADAMGLGKTLTTLALVWTLLKQGPGGRPAVGKALIVTPSSLTRSWAEEARKWLGNERLPTTILAAGAEGRQQALDFKHGGVVRVGITSYETLRKHSAELAGCVGLVVADEGHRLKAAGGNKTISALTGLGCGRRVLLTGTPLQNNLSEFFAMANVVIPDVLGTLAVFERVFGGPITRSRDKFASAEEKALGAERSRELARRVETFVLRRGAEVNAAYLPPLSLFVVFCRPTPLQVRLLKELLGSGATARLLSGAGGDFGDQTLSVLTSLRKICNHPALYDGGNAGDAAAPGTSATAEASGSKPAIAAGAVPPVDISQSGKLATLAVMLQHVIGVEGGRCVVVSGSTAMLDLVGALCGTLRYTTCRIDGTTDVAKRQDIVNAFNRFGVFLLSTTAGGAGLNLTGANRLVLLDSHWNPALDAQAMARVWRDGQRLPCVVYRLLTTGTIEEKIYQRQRAKGDIAAVTVGDGSAGIVSGGSNVAASRGQFSREELRQLFMLRTDTACDTADVLAAGAAGPGGMSAGEVFADCSATCGDAPLAAVLAAGHVSFVHLERRTEQELAAVAAAPGKGACAQDAGGEEGAELAPAEAAGAGGDGAFELDVDEEGEA